MIVAVLSIFAVQIFERAPFAAKDLGPGSNNWLQNAGGFACLALGVLTLAYVLRRLGVMLLVPRVPAGAAGGHVGVASLYATEHMKGYFAESDRTWLPAFFLITFGLSAVLYGLSFATDTATPIDLKVKQGEPIDPVEKAKRAAATQVTTFSSTTATVGGGIAVFGIGLPFLLDLFRLRFRRIWAITIVTFKEAIRSKILWIFSFLLVVFLFADWFLPHKPEDQLRGYVTAVYAAMTIILLATAGLLASFGIPNDLKNMNVHTIVTKPVEKFEIVLGRFLGYSGLITLLLVLMTTFSLMYVWVYGVNPDAVRESLRARVPVYGDLEFRGTQRKERGDDVGREWEYRSYIAGGPRSPQRAIWSFNEVPSSWAGRDAVPCEFSFDIFRTTKGEEGKGVFVTILFLSARCDPESPDFLIKLQDFQKERETLKQAQDADDKAVAKKLAAKHGIFLAEYQEVFDYKTFGVDVPGEVFQNHQDSMKEQEREAASRGKAYTAKPFKALVKCESPTQYLGVAKYDLYLLDTESWFLVNYYKGAIGLWIRLILVIGIAVSLSTYLSGIISWITTMVIYILGYFQFFIRELVEGTGYDKLPAESAWRLVMRENQVTPLDKTTMTETVQYMDKAFQLQFRIVLSFLPDVDRFDWSSYVAEGFNIGTMDVLVHLVLLAAHVVPWLVLGYYLMKSREIAA